MRKIIDSNYYVNPELERYLNSSEGNFAVICEYAGIEAYKAKNPVEAIFSSLSILRKYPKQVIVLKSSRTIAIQKISRRGYLSRMIHTEQTKGFSEFCTQVTKAKNGSQVFIDSINGLAHEALFEADKAAQGSKAYKEAAAEVIKQFTKNELQLILSKKDLPDFLFKKVSTHMFEMTLHSYAELGVDVRRKKLIDVINSLIFRQVACSYLMTLRWYAGGSPPKNDNKIRNHVYDSGFSSYATMFDGLLSDDGAAQGTYKEAKKFLDRLYDAVNKEIISATHLSASPSG